MEHHSWVVFNKVWRSFSFSANKTISSAYKSTHIFFYNELIQVSIIEIDNSERGVLGDFTMMSDIRITRVLGAVPLGCHSSCDSREEKVFGQKVLHRDKKYLDNKYQT